MSFVQLFFGPMSFVQLTTARHLFRAGEIANLHHIGSHVMWGYAMPFVRYKYLDNGIISNRMQLARAIERYGFPKPVALGENTLAWHLEEVENWLETRPRRTPKTGAQKPEAAAARTEAN